MSGVTFASTTKRFGDVVALEALDLDIASGEFLVLLGPSGCGKSTALRLVAGLDEPTEGTVLIGGRDMAGVEPKNRELAMVFQSYALYPHKSVRANIEFPLRSRKVPADERNARVTEVADMLGLSELLDRRPGQLSGGQRQRVALGRAIVRRPGLYLMDEPLSNLDARTRVHMRVELTDLHREFGATVIYVTHDQVEALTMGTRVAVLDQGRLQQVGPPSEVYDRPANLFVARFVGGPPMSTVPGELAIESDRPVVRTAAGYLDLATTPALATLTPGQSVVAGVRPEHLHPGAPDSGPGLKAIVRHVESLGHESHVVCDLPGNIDFVTVRVAAGDAVPAPGDAIRVTAPPDQVHLFDPETSERLAP